MRASYHDYRTHTWTTDNDECEHGCGEKLSPDSYVEGELGHYCSEDCLERAEGGSADENERASERRQMGIDF